MQFSLKSLALLAIALSVSAQDVSTPPDQQVPSSDTGTQVPNSSQPPATDSVSVPAASSPAASSQPSSASVSAPVSSSASATSSSATPTGSSLSDCLGADPFSTTDYFASIKYTEPLLNTTAFSYEYHNTWKLVTNKVNNENYILYCTSQPPNITLQSKTFIQIPVKKLAVVDTRALGYLDLLGQDDIVYVGNVSNVTTPCVNSNPQLYNMSSSTFSQSAYDLVIFPDNGRSDPHGIGMGMTWAAPPLSLAEWIKYLALFTNQEPAAQQIFDKIKQSYETTRDSINSADISFKRNITFMQYDLPSTKFGVMQDVYFKNLTADAGANLTTATIAQPGDPSTMRAQLTNSSLVVDFTELIAPNNTFNYWNDFMQYIQPNMTNAANTAFSNAEQHGGLYINDPEAPPFERNLQLWRVDRTASSDGADDFWTRGLARPDLMILDLVVAQYPDYPGGHTRVFLRDFANNEPSQTANAASYGCGVATNLAIASKQSYANHTADAPTITFSSSLSLPAIIGLSIGGGLVAIACIAASAVTLSKKIKNRKRFTRLTDVGGEAFDMPRHSQAEEAGLYGRQDFEVDDIPPTGRFGGSSRQMS